MANNEETKMNAEKIANKSYDPADYGSSDETAQGLAMTHEQVSDAYMEGTIDARIDEVDENGNKVDGGKGEEIPRKGYEQ